MIKCEVKAMRYLVAVLSILLFLGGFINFIFATVYGIDSGDALGSVIRMVYSLPFVFLSIYTANIYANLRDEKCWYKMDWNR